MTSPAPKQSKQRVVFIDQARALALLMMMVGHSLDAFLGEPWRSGTAYREYQFFRGITSALFLMVSGFSFVVASFRYWDDYTRWSPRLAARMRRIAYILFLGYLLHMFGGTLARMIAYFTPERWEAFLRFDVLQNIGLGLLVLHLAVVAMRKMERFPWVVAGLMVAVLVTARVTYDPAVDARLPLWVSTAVNLYHRSLFPLIPFTAFMLIGAFFAYFYWKLQQQGRGWKAMAVLMACGAGLLVFEWALKQVPGGVFPYAASGAHLPGNTFARAGSAMLVIGAFFFLGHVVRILPRFSYVMSQDSLAIYVVHLPLVYSGTLGVFQDMRQQMTPLQVWSFIVALVTSMVAMAWTIQWVRRHYPVLQTKIRRALIVAWALQFVLWPSYSWFSVSVSVAFGVFVVFGGHRVVARFLSDIASRRLPWSAVGEESSGKSR